MSREVVAPPHGAWLAEADAIFDHDGTTPIAEGEAFFSMQLATHKVPMRLHKENRAKLVARLAAAGHDSGVVLLQGGCSQFRYCSDTEQVFRQESFFNYLFGVSEPDWFGCIELPTGKTTLFMPRLPPDYAVWMGKIMLPAFFTSTYEPDGGVLYADELDTFLQDKLLSAGRPGQPSDSSPESNSDSESMKPRRRLFLLKGRNTDSGLLTTTTADFDGISKFSACTDTDTLHPHLSECRVTKSALEVDTPFFLSLSFSL